MRQTRNFSIVAHIDHGKSTLADRLIQKAGLISERDFHDQLLDDMDIERERGITIKSNTVTLPYRDEAGQDYDLNLIDTPGHVDFTYEVSRALAACEGVLLLIDATQGVEAQTLAHLYSALEHDLTIVPVINKIDLKAADVERVKEQIGSDLGLDPDEAVLISAKTGQGVEEILKAIVERIPAPAQRSAEPLACLVFDAYYDSFRGTVVSFRIVSGRLEPGDVIRFFSNGATHTVEEIGRFSLKHKPTRAMQAGDVGYLIAGIKTVSDVLIGDTFTHKHCPAEKPLPGFKEVKPVVFSSIYPISSDDYPALSDAMEKYKLNDAALTYQKDTSIALGQGFRCGFLGLLHLEVAQERLEREYGQSIIMTMPSVRYRFVLSNGQAVEVDNPAHFPDPVQVRVSEEPFILTSIMIPDRYMGAVMQLCLDCRGVNSSFSYPAPGRMEIHFDLPLAEVIFDFYDKLKSITQGYGSFDYELIGYRPSDLVKLDILVNSEPVDALATMIHRDRARTRALQICKRLKDEIPRQMFKIAIQGAIGSTIIARTNISAFRKDVTAKCYGGDVSRKRKLLEKQKRGKKRMKMVGQVQIPQSAFVSVLRTQKD
ncbi:MAG: elongation factor 4 [Deltaproteobacteria bacterium]|nr:elongation factor 4 [Deltaproteobacteria bacterium]